MFSNHSLSVKFRETSQCGEVSVEKREAVVIIFEVQALSHALGKLIDETEFTVIVTGTNSVEDCRIDSKTEGLTNLFADAEFAVNRRTFSLDHQVDFWAIRELLVLNHVKGDDSIDEHKDVANCEASLSSRRSF